MVSACEKPSQSVHNHQKNGEKTSNFQVSTLRSQLSQDNGRAAFEQLLRTDDDGFDQIIGSLSKGEVGIENFTDWTYDLQTRSDDGKGIYERFETQLFIKSEKNDALAENLATNFYSRFPADAIEQLHKDQRLGAQRIAAIVMKQAQKRPTPAGD